MSRYGFDLDNTLDASPEFAHLARALCLAGHKVYIITGSDFSKKAIEAKLYGLNVVNYHKIIKVDGANDIEIGKAKGEACNKHNITLFFDNDPEVLKGIAAVSNVSRCYVLNSAVLQPAVAPVPKRSLCPCQVVSGDEFIESRCLHCTSFLENEVQRISHSRFHHFSDGVPPLSQQHKLDGWDW